MEKDKIYFGENGLTITSCNYIANMAKEWCETKQEELDSLSFVNESISLIGGKPTTVKTGVSPDYLKTIENSLNDIAEAHCLIAWLREAIKAKDALLKEVKNKSLADWCTETGKDYPAAPFPAMSLTEDDVLATWSVKDRNRYLALGAIVSTYGKFLMDSYKEAKSALKKAVNAPVSYSENGQDTIVHNFSASVPTENVDAEFFHLQELWRNTQAELNGYRHKIDEALNESAVKRHTEYIKAVTDRTERIKELSAEFQAWQENTSHDIAGWKVIIPNALEPVYRKIQELKNGSK